MKSNKEIRQLARQELKNYWTMPVLATLIMGIISMFCSSPNIIANFGAINFRRAMQGTNILITILVTLPLSYGFILSFLDFLRRDKEDTVIQMFAGFKSYGRAISVNLLSSIFILLWTLLLIIPGIIKFFSYGMTIYISKDHPELSANECIELSISMMDGHKKDLFLLYLSFLGWAFLSILSLGIGFFWLTPYIHVSTAIFYEELKADYETEYEESMIEVE